LFFAPLLSEPQADLRTIEMGYGGPVYSGPRLPSPRQEKADAVVVAAAAVMGMGDEFNAEAFRGAVLEAWRAVKGELDPIGQTSSGR
jgi:hypothetical protein